MNNESYTEKDQVRVYGGRIATIEKVIYEMVNGEETDEVHCYEMEIGGESGYIVYPEDIEE
jgi:hypothetical protein